jgi:hypothetical protein
MGAVPRERLGIASGLLSLSRTTGNTIGVPLIGSVFGALSASVAVGTDVAVARGKKEQNYEQPSHFSRSFSRGNMRTKQSRSRSYFGKCCDTFIPRGNVYGCTGTLPPVQCVPLRKRLLSRLMEPFASRHYSCVGTHKQ